APLKRGDGVVTRPARALSPSRSRDGSIEASLELARLVPREPRLRRVRATAPLKGAPGGTMSAPTPTGLRRVRATAPLKRDDGRLREERLQRLRRVRATAPLKHPGPNPEVARAPSLRRVRATAPLKQEHLCGRRAGR